MMVSSMKCIISSPSAASSSVSIEKVRTGQPFFAKVSAVARPYGGAAVTGTGGNASWSAGDSANSLISFGDMFVFTGTVSLTGQF